MLQIHQILQASKVSEKRYYKPFILSMFIMFIQEFSGVNYFAVYILDIFEDAGSSISPCLSSTIIMITQCLGVMMAMTLIDRFGRKLLLIVSSTLSGISLVAYGIFILLDKRGTDLDDYRWLPLACLIGFSFFFNLGLGPIPWILNVELFPSEVRGAGGSVCTAFNWFVSYLTVIGGAYVEQKIGAETCYFIYGGVCLFGAAFTLLFVPETKGRTEQELRRLFE